MIFLNLKFKSVLHLANELPYFSVDPDGTPRLAIELGYPIIECHGHLANNYLFAKPVDFWQNTGRSNNYFSLLGMPVDLTQYSGANLSENDPYNYMHYAQTLFTSKIGSMPHHTAANLLAEMDRMGVSHAINLAIDMPVFSRNSDQVLDVYEKSDRLIPFVSVHPRDPFWRRKMERYVERGARGIKIHPEIQLMAVDNPAWAPILKFCEDNDLIIFYHSSVSPVEPGAVSGHAKVSRSALPRFEHVLDTYGNATVMVGHGGMLEYRTLIELAKKYPNCICEIDGQPPQHLEEFFAEVDHGRMVAGSDWPVYPLVYQYAKPLIATEGHPELRYKVLHANAARILGLEVAPYPELAAAGVG